MAKKSKEPVRVYVFGPKLHGTTAKREKEGSVWVYRWQLNSWAFTARVTKVEANEAVDGSRWLWGLASVTRRGLASGRATTRKMALAAAVSAGAAYAGMVETTG